MPYLLPATVEHALRVAEEMRACDRAEVQATSGDSPGVALLRSMQASLWTFACCTDDGIAFAVGGVSEIQPGSGSPWLLATDRLQDNSKWFLRQTRRVVASMHGSFPTLLNFVDARNIVSIHWLRWAGFEIHPTIPYGVLGLPFHPFSKVHHV